MKRRGFSALEMLVTITIISILMSLLLSALVKVMALGKITQAKAEIAQLSITSGMWRDKMLTNPEFWGGGPNGEFRLCSNYLDQNGNPIKDASTGLPWPEITFLKRVWPMISLADNGLRSSGLADNSIVLPSNPILLDCNQAAMFWFTGLNYTSYQGFSTNPNQPFQPYPPGGGIPRVGPWMQLQKSRITDPVTKIIDNRYRDPYGTPYCFMGYDQSLKSYPSPSLVPNVSPYFILMGNVKWTPGNNGQRFPISPYMYDSSYSPTSICYSTTGVQVICAGPNMQFGTGGLLLLGNGGEVGFDDLSNFQMGNLGSPE